MNYQQIFAPGACLSPVQMDLLQQNTLRASQSPDQTCNTVECCVQRHYMFKCNYLPSDYYDSAYKQNQVGVSGYRDLL